MSREPSLDHVSKWQCALSATPHLFPPTAAVDEVAHFHAQNGTRGAAGVQAIGASGLSEMLNDDATFLVTFYAPWCRYSQLFVMNGGDDAPLEQLGRSLASLKGPRVVKFNVDEHGHPPGFSFNGVPTIILVAEGGKEKLEYTANPLQLENLMAFALTRGGTKPAPFTKH